MAWNVDGRWRVRGETRRDDWLQAGVLGGFIATFAVTVVLAIAYGAANVVGEEGGGRFARWVSAMAQNPIAERTRDGVVVAVAANP